MDSGSVVVSADLIVEPSLAVRRRPPPRRRRRGLLVASVLMLVAGLVGVGVLLPTGNLLLPFVATVTIEGKTGSKGDYFLDEQVQRLLLAHHIRVHITQTGSRDVAVHDIEQYDYVFPSGQPAADLILNDRNSTTPPKYVRVFRPFTSPVILATYREYAETLRANGIATPQDSSPDPLYYRLDLAKFLDLVAVPGTTWNTIGLQKTGVSNGNGILAHSPNICSSNSSGTYMGLVAFVENGNQIPRNIDDADRLANQIKPKVTAQGLAAADLFRTYITPEGKGVAPIVVVYEHQFLAYQLDQQARTGSVDRSRVLLYPTTNFLAQPQFIALDPLGDRLGQLVTTDSALRKRMVELGYRVLAPTPDAEALPLDAYLRSQNVPVPSSGNDDTTAVLPELPIFEEMIKITGGCP
jgi:hypothetical protein